MQPVGNVNVADPAMKIWDNSRFCLSRFIEDRLMWAVGCGCERTGSETTRGVSARMSFTGIALSHFGFDKINVAYFGNCDDDNESPKCSKPWPKSALAWPGPSKPPLQCDFPPAIYQPGNALRRFWREARIPPGHMGVFQA